MRMSSLFVDTDQ